MGTLGRHLLLDLKECNERSLDNLDFIKGVLHAIAEQAGRQVLGESFQCFQPQGLSGIVLISGSHVGIHTWPEFGYAAIDLFTHDDSFKPDAAVELIVDKLESRNPSIVELKRGF